MEIKELKTKIKIVFPEESEIFMAEEFLDGLKDINLSEKPVELDMSGVQTIDTVFLQLVISVIKTIKTQNNTLILKSSEVLDNAQALYGVDLVSLIGGEG